MHSVSDRYRLNRKYLKQNTKFDTKKDHVNSTLWEYGYMAESVLDINFGDTHVERRRLDMSKSVAIVK